MRMYGELKEFLGRFGQFWEENFYRVDCGIYSGRIGGDSGKSVKVPHFIGDYRESNRGAFGDELIKIKKVVIRPPNTNFSRK